MPGRKHSDDHMKCSLLLPGKIPIDLFRMKFHEDPAVLEVEHTARQTWQSQVLNYFNIYLLTRQKTKAFRVS
jgi:hypothetical protein